METLETLKQDPHAAAYPETLAIAESQGKSLRALASNMKLRWESRFECGNPLDTGLSAVCDDGRTVHMKIYPVQALSTEAVEMVTAVPSGA